MKHYIFDGREYKKIITAEEYRQAKRKVGLAESEQAAAMDNTSLISLLIFVDKAKAIMEKEALCAEVISENQKIVTGFEMQQKLIFSGRQLES
jgi:hypothetical protein